eukprot:TRINITY_DN206_c0_g1_i1.p2 TRINITY_DN206_c0_g1~~TRINITY_DN206_c0_g1_i1.p2  ORF type:complete len:139 (+),score=14.74 TRINITY_DN206_c0_g1_i1:3645-4061(+)
MWTSAARIVSCRAPLLPIPRRMDYTGAERCCVSMRPGAAAGAPRICCRYTRYCCWCVEDLLLMGPELLPLVPRCRTWMLLVLDADEVLAAAAAALTARVARFDDEVRAGGMLALSGVVTRPAMYTSTHVRAQRCNAVR